MSTSSKTRLLIYPTSSKLEKAKPQVAEILEVIEELNNTPMSPIVFRPHEKTEMPISKEFIPLFISAPTEVVRNVKFNRGTVVKSSRRNDSFRLPKPMVYLKHYRLERVLSKSHLSALFLSQDMELDRPVVVRVINHDYCDKNHRESLLDQAKSLSRLSHRGVVRLYDFGSTEDVPCYVVNQFVNGQSMKTLLNHNELNYLEAAQLVSRIAEALNYVHSMGVVHRDIKPSNILLDQNLNPYVANFGLRFPDENSEFRGSFNRYMAPEFVRGELHRVDGRSDLFSLGVVLYEVLNKKRLPYQLGEEVHLSSDSEPISSQMFSKTIPEMLVRICQRALAVRVSDRYSTADELANDLNVFLGNGPTHSASSREVSTSKGKTVRDSVFPKTLSPKDRQSITVAPKGLVPFESQDADYFLDLLPGTRDRDGVPNSLRFWELFVQGKTNSDNCAVGVIYGPAGCGKSSFVKAGLLPLLPHNVVPIYVEASPDETEIRILRRLWKEFPDLTVCRTLQHAILSLRQGTQLIDKKVLIVIDQFEQWLQASKGQQNAELTRALRQCDGSKVKCIIASRDNFWNNATSFLREIEVSLCTSSNVTALDEFSFSHAEHVLVSFGQAAGKLPIDIEIPRSQYQDFIKRTVTILADNGKVSCSRIALFAELTRHRAWTMDLFKQVREAESFFAASLEGVFSDPSSPVQSHRHATAVRALLSSLLPAPKCLELPCISKSKLLELTGFTDCLQEFDELIELLTDEVRLVTSVQELASTAEIKFRLVNDYLVNPLRNWLFPKALPSDNHKARAEKHFRC